MTKGQAESGVTCDVEEECTIASGEAELVFWWAAERNATEHEGTSIEGELLLALLSLFADKADSLELFDPESGDPNRGQYGLNRSK